MQAPSLQAASVKRDATIACAGHPAPHTPRSRILTLRSAVATPCRSLAARTMPPGQTTTPIASPAHHAKAEARPAGSHPPAKVSVIAPGGGTGKNSNIYAELGKDPRFIVDVVGQSRAPYDRYPEWWPHGFPAPNLASFADDVLRQGWVERSDCLVFGSRGGQVVLPTFWQQKGDLVPPAVVLNGGCAMKLPKASHWPDGAVTFLMIGGQDKFRREPTVEEYIAVTQAQVPRGNRTTAILFVNEMQHMPQAELLRAVLPLMLRAVLAWKRAGGPPEAEFNLLRAVATSGGWNGRLMHTRGPSTWAPLVEFGPSRLIRSPASTPSPRPKADAAEGCHILGLKRSQEEAAAAAKTQATCSISPSPPRLPISTAGTSSGTPVAAAPCNGRFSTPSRLAVPTGSRCSVQIPVSGTVSLCLPFSPSCSSANSVSPSHFYVDTSPVRHPSAVLQ